MCLSAVAGFALLSLGALTSPAAVYNGNQVVSPPDFNGIVGNGKLTFTDNGSTISGTFTRGGSASDIFAYSLVIFIDSVSGQGFTSTAALTDKSTYAKRSISGVNPAGTSKSTVVFANGFAADYAIVLNAYRPISALYQLNSDSSMYIARNLPDYSANPGARDFSFNIDWSDIGITGAGGSFKFESTYITTDGSRSLESFETINGTVGYGTDTFDNYHVYPSPVPEPTHIALGIFGGVAGLVSLGAAFKKQSGSLPG
jgi:hypothetical protein